MKKIVTTLMMSTLLIPSFVTHAEETPLLDNEETAEVEIIADSDTEYYFESITLQSESYDGEFLIRYFQDDDSGKLSARYIELPASIISQVDVDDENAVAKVTSLMAQYYAQESINNIPSLNMLLLSYVPDTPYSKVSVSKEYRETFSENLNYVLSTLKEDAKVEILEEEKELMKDFYDDQAVPFETKEELLIGTEKFYEEIRIKWYEKLSTYIVLGSAIALITAFIIFKRR